MAEPRAEEFLYLMPRESHASDEIFATISFLPSRNAIRHTTIGEPNEFFLAFCFPDEPLEFLTSHILLCGRPISFRRDAR